MKKKKKKKLWPKFSSILPSLMKSKFVAIALMFALMAVAVHGYYVPPPPTIYRVQQQVDHFNAGDERTFTQRVLVYSDRYEQGGPILFTPGGEANAMGGYEHNGFMWDHFEGQNALYVFPEHRDYGESPLFGEESWSDENLKYLSVEQALADYVENLAWAKRTFNVSAGTKVAAFGGSYPGELALFMRVHYPEIVDGAMASSAPLRYHPHMVKENAFYEVTTRVFDVGQPGCSEHFYKGVVELGKLFARGLEGRAEVERELGLCSAPRVDDEHLINLWLANAMADLTMENYPYAFGGLPAWPLSVACTKLRDALSRGGSPLYALRQAINVDYNATGDVRCHNISSEYYPCADITGCGPPSSTDATSWNYQSCTQIVSSVATLGYRYGDMFAFEPYNYTAVVDYCKRTFDVTPTPYHLLETYDWSNTTNVIFSNGLYDGWAPGGVLHASNPSQHIILIDKAAHHLDLRGADPADPESVRLARQQEHQIILSWLR
jgi:lysosomal Pro-X carboxypeptidase